MVAVDPVASLRITSTTIRLASRQYVISGHSAADWLEKIVDGTLYLVIPGWCEEEEAASEITEMLLDGVITEEELSKITFEVVTAVGGRQYWWIFNLLGNAMGNNANWAILNGHMVMRGLDPDRVSLAAWIDALYSTCISHMHDQDQRIQFDTAIEAIPPGAVMDEEEEGVEFLAIMAQM